MSLHRARGATVRLLFDRFEDRTVPSISNIPANAIAVAAPAGDVPIVRIIDGYTQADIGSILAFEPSFRGGVQATLGDVNGDKIEDLVVAAGAGGAPRVRVFDGTDGHLLADFFAYEPSFRGGLNVAVGDVDGDGRGDIILGTGNGGGPRVRVLSGADMGQTVLQDYFAYEPTFRGGVTVAAGDVNGDGVAEVITGTGVGGAPRVEVFDGDVSTQNFFAFDSGFRGGVPVVAADLDGDGKAEIVAVTGPGNLSQVATFSDENGGEALNHVFASDADFNGGVSVGAADTDGDGKQEVVLTSRSADGVKVQVFAGLSGTLAGEFDRSFHVPLLEAAGFDSASGGVAHFTVMLSEVSDQPVTVHYTTADGTAHAGTNYVATSGSLTFQPGDTSLTVPVTILGNAGGDATVLFMLSNPTNGIVATAAASGTITGGTGTVTV
jgi:hypothetical protein